MIMGTIRLTTTLICPLHKKQDHRTTWLGKKVFFFCITRNCSIWIVLHVEPVCGSSRRQRVWTCTSNWRWTTTSLITFAPGWGAIVLQEEENICFCGYVDMAVVYGTVEVCTKKNMYYHTIIVLRVCG